MIGKEQALQPFKGHFQPLAGVNWAGFIPRSVPNQGLMQHRPIEEIIDSVSRVHFVIIKSPSKSIYIPGTQMGPLVLVGV